jgi:rhamnose utilization protein RhaD (predicted bifunctional aldolase and dehydrogenase)
MNKRILSSLDKLVELSHEFGRQDRGWVKPREGNTSARFSETSFFVKASGSCLSLAETSDFIEVDLAKAFDFVGTNELTGDELNVALESIKTDSRARRPSVEALVHAVCLRECTWVAHCYPVSVLSVLRNAQNAEAFFAGNLSLLPDSVVVPYVDSGFELAFAVRDALHGFKVEHRKFPKVIFLENHSIFILGQSELELVNSMEALDEYSKLILKGQTFFAASDGATS